MGIITGGTRLAYDYSKEAHDEEKRWAREKREADTAREIESERKTWWSIGSTLICLGLNGGPICPVVGAVVGNIAKGVGEWKDESIESYDLTEEVGKFEKGQIEDVRNYNRSLDAADKAEFWEGIMDIGKAAAFSFKYGTASGADVGIAEKIESWSPSKWGGQEGIEFGGKEAWQMFFNRPDTPAIDITDISSDYTGRHKPDFSRYYHDMDPADIYEIPTPSVDLPTLETTAAEDLWKIMYGPRN